MPLPNQYSTVSPKNALFSFSELQTGLSYRTFFFGGYQETTTNYPVLTTQQTVGVYTFQETTSTPEYATFISSAFDLPATMKGRVYLDLSAKMVSTFGGWGVYANFTYEIFKYSGATATSLGSGSITSYDLQTGNTTKYKATTGIIDISNEVYFAVGDKIQIKIGIYKTNVNDTYGSAGTLTFLGDPLQQDVNAIIASKCHIPFLTE